jgi:hypothetical protein
MLDFLKHLKNEKFDFLTFLEGEKENSIEIVGTEYTNPGEPIDGSNMGSSYHVVLFRDHKENKNEYDDVDSFDAILIDPLEYISGLIPQGWYGIIARKTTTSRPLIDRMLDNFNKVV